MRGGRREAERAHDERGRGRASTPSWCGGQRPEEGRHPTEHVRPQRGSVTEGGHRQRLSTITLDSAALSDMAKDPPVETRLTTVFVHCSQHRLFQGSPRLLVPPDRLGRRRPAISVIPSGGRVRVKAWRKPEIIGWHCSGPGSG